MTPPATNTGVQAAVPLERAGGRPVFRDVFEAELPYVCQSARRLGVPERDVEDVAHDVFVAVHRHLDDWDAERPIRPWLFGFAFRVASAYRRRAGNRHERVEQPPDVADQRPRADQLMEDEQRRRLVLEALDALDDDKRAVFVMHSLDGHAVPEIAAALEIPLNTAYSRLRLAREEFAAAAKRLLLRRGTP